MFMSPLPWQTPQLYFQYSLNLLAALLIQPRKNASTTAMVYQALLPSSFVFLCKFAEGVEHCPYQKRLPVLLALSPFPGLKMKLTGLQFPWSPPHCRECHWQFSSILASHHDFPKITEWLCKVSSSLSTWKCIPSGPFTHS